MMALAEPASRHERLTSHGGSGGAVAEAKAAQQRPVQANKTALSASRQTKAGLASQGHASAPIKMKVVNPVSGKKNSQNGSHAEIQKKSGQALAIPAHKKI
jgi:hypothetical protein